eukprot:195275-Lingulodinium_polyedra.AAC.1
MLDAPEQEQKAITAEGMVTASVARVCVCAVPVSALSSLRHSFCVCAFACCVSWIFPRPQPTQ